MDYGPFLRSRKQLAIQWLRLRHIPVESGIEVKAVKKNLFFFFFIIIIYKIRRDMSNKILGPTPLHARHVTFNQEFNPILGSTFGGVGG